MLEAKAKDQGHKAQVLSEKKKKKGLHKNFSGDLKKKNKKKTKKKKVFTKIFQAISKKKKKKKKKGPHKNFSSGLHWKTFSRKFFKRSTKF